MNGFVRHRLVSVAPVLLLVLVVIFSLVRVMPGDPAVTLLGPGATEQQIEALRQQLNLDQPVLIQFWDYVSGIARGDFGESLQTKRPIADDIKTFLPATIELALVALLIALVVGVPLGILAAIRPGTIIDAIARLLALLGVSAPAFWFALILQVIFSIGLGILPVSGRLSPFYRPERITGFILVDALLQGNLALFWDALQHLILPASVLAAFLIGTLTRILRASILEQLSQDYARTAAAKGLTGRVVLFHHVVRNSILPALTILGLKFAELLGGAILTETVFAWPGLGRYIYTAISTRDYPAIQATTLIFAMVYIVSSLVIDLLYGLLDPRIRVGASS